MKIRLSTALLLFGIFIAVSQALQAVEPADDIIRNAAADVERYEGQASGLAPGRSANAARILKLAKLSHERLDGSANKANASWAEVNQRYIALEGRLEELMNPAAPKAAEQSAPAAESPTAPAAPAGQATAAATTPAAPKTTQETVPPLVSGQRVQVKKLTRDIASRREGIVTTGPSHFQDSEEVAARQKSLQQFTDALKRYPQVDDADVQAARSEYAALREALAKEFARAQDQLAQLGDVQASLAMIEANGKTYAAPQALQVPFTADDAKAWVSSASSARTVAEHNLKQLAIIAPIAHLPNNPGTPQGGAPYDANDVMRLQRNSQNALNAVQANYESMATELNNRMQQMESEIGSRWQEDPNNDDKRWLFIGEGQQENADKLYAEALAIAQSSVSLEQALGREPAQANALIAKIDKTKAEFARKREVALQGSRLPEPKSTDSDLLAIAKQILENPKYEFAGHGRIVLTTSEVVERDRKDSDIDIDKAELTTSGDVRMTGTETTWTYKWREFKFAAPVKETGSDTWYIWWITAKNFSSGGPRTPLNKWISGEANKGNLILKKNI